MKGNLGQSRKISGDQRVTVMSLFTKDVMTRQKVLRRFKIQAPHHSSSLTSLVPENKSTHLGQVFH